MRNPYRRPLDRPPQSCFVRGLSREDLDVAAARRAEPVRPGQANPWKSCLERMRVGEHARFHDRTGELALALTGFGGASALVRSHPDEAGEIVRRGQLWPGKDALMVGGAGRQCHVNASQLWAARQDRMVLATGYALADDGLWRQHSWTVDVSGDRPRVCETTVRSLLYFGMALTDEESMAMCRIETGTAPRMQRAPVRVPAAPDTVDAPAPAKPR